jgi:hypothetical protein
MNSMRYKRERVGYPSGTESTAAGQRTTGGLPYERSMWSRPEAKTKKGELVEEVVEGEGPASLLIVEAAHGEGNHDEL